MKTPTTLHQALSKISRHALDKVEAIEIEESDFGTWCCKARLGSSVCYLGSELESFEFSTIDDAVSFLKLNGKSVLGIKIHIY